MTRQRLFNKNFVLLALGQVSSLMGNYSLKFAISMYVLEITGSAAIFSGILAVSMVPVILLSPFGGILADRVNRRNIMVTLDALSGMTVLAAAGFWNQGSELLVIGALLVILSVLGAFESPAVQACVPQMLSGELILKGNAVVGQIQAATSLTAPFLGSVLYTAWGIRPVLGAAAVCFFITAFMECFISAGSEPEYGNKTKKQKIGTAVREDFAVSVRFLGKERTEVLKLLLLAGAVSLFAAGTVVVGFPYLVRTTLGLSAWHYGIAESVMGAAAVLGGAVAGILGERLRIRRMHRLIGAVGICLMLGGAVFCLPAGISGKYLILLAMFGGCQMACSIFSIYTLSVIQQKTPRRLTGKVMACVFTLSMCAQPVGQILYGALFDIFADSVYWVLIPSGGMVWALGMAAARFFGKMEA